MRKHVFSLVFLLIMMSGPIFSQMRVIQGIVVTSGGYLLRGVEVMDKSGKALTFTTGRGDFHVEIPCPDSCLLRFIYPGFQTKEVYLKPEGKPTIVLFESEDEYIPGVSPDSQDEPSGKNKVGVHWQLGADIFKMNFDNFTTELGQKNVDQLNNFPAVVLFKVGFDIRDIYFSLDFGISGSAPRNEDNPDSIHIGVSWTHYGLHLGYIVFKNRQFIVTPDVGLKWYRSRLVNSPWEYEIDLADYPDQRGLDIRFTQLSWYAGVNLHYRLPAFGAGMSGWTVGAYMGYLGRINTTPRVKSIDNKLLTDNSVEVGALNWGITLGIYLD